MNVPGRGVRLLLSATGDVVGVEVLGWSSRTADPAEVAVKVLGVAEVLDNDDPLAQALAALEAVPVPAGRPVDEQGAPMMNAREASERIGKDRSWIIGSEWWIAKAWVAEYIQRQETKAVGTA